MRAQIVRAIASATCVILCRCGGGPGGFGASADLVEIDTTSLPTPSTGAWYAAPIEARGPHAPLVWRVAGGQMPEGLALDADSGLVSGYPRREGSSRFTVQVQDGPDEAGSRDRTFAASSRSFSLRVERGPLTVLPLPVPPMEYGASFSHRFEAAGGTPPYTFVESGGTLPSGVGIKGDGTCVGVPSRAENPYVVRVQATDAAGDSAEGEFSLRVVVLPLAIEAAVLPDAALGFPYFASSTIKPRGGGPPFTWRIGPSLAALPPGIVLDAESGDLSGKSTAVGTYAFRLEVVDAAGQVAGRDAAIRVNPGPVLNAVQPNRLPPPGGFVTLAGQGFQPGMTVRVGASSPAPANVLDSTRATVVPPTVPVQGGWVTVTVANPDGGAYARDAAFRYPLRTVDFTAAGVKGTPRDHSRGIAAGDVDRDGLCDIAHVGAAGIEIIKPVGPAYSGAWAAVNVRSDGSYLDVRLADVDADGDLDIVALRTSTTETIEVYLNDGTGKFPAAPSRTTTYTKPPSNHNPNSLAVGDVNGDGVIDVAVTSSRGNQGVVWIWKGLGDGSFVEIHEAIDTIFDASGGLFAATGVALADLNGDGRDDVIVTDGFPSACAAGQTCPTTPSTGGAPNTHPGGNDFVAWVARSGATGVPGAWAVAKVSGASALLNGCNEGLAVYDGDGDGLLDLAVFGGYQDFRGAGIAFLKGDGTGAFTERLVVATTYDRRFGARIDANLDGCDALLLHLGTERDRIAGGSSPPPFLYLCA